MDNLRTIKENLEIQIIEKRSKFIASIFYVTSEEEIKSILSKIKAKYYDAKHHCFAYRLVQEKNLLERYSDDGEPNGTAGTPILNVISKNDLVNVLIVVTRYFGGILLGTGGLTRTYSDASKRVVEDSKVILLDKGYRMQILLEYGEFDSFRYYLKKRNINMICVNYLENIECIVEISENEKQLLFSNLSNMKFKMLKTDILEEKYIQKNIDI